MEKPAEQQKAFDTSAEKRPSNELAGLIRKLRWAAMEEEAKELQQELARRRAAGAVSVIGPARETD